MGTFAKAKPYDILKVFQAKHDNIITLTSKSSRLVCANVPLSNNAAVLNNVILDYSYVGHSS